MISELSFAGPILFKHLGPNIYDMPLEILQYVTKTFNINLLQ